MQSPRITEAAFSLPGGEGFAGGALEWITPFSILCWAGLVLGYALLGAAWLVLKTEGDLRDWAYRRLDWLLAGVVVVLIAVFAFALVIQLRVLDRWLDDLRLVSLQLLGVIAVVGLLIGVRQRRDRVPFAMAMLLVTSAFLGVSFWPYMIPYSVTVQQAAAPTQSLEFLFWGAGLIVFPVVLIYIGDHLLDLPRQGRQGRAGVWTGFGPASTATRIVSMPIAPVWELVRRSAPSPRRLIPARGTLVDGQTGPHAEGDHNLFAGPRAP